MSDLKFKVVSRLLNNETPKQIAEDLEDVSLAKALRWSRELATAREAGTVGELIDLDKAMLDEVLDEVASRTPEVLHNEATDSLTKLSGMQSAAAALQEDFQRTAKLIDGRIKSMALCTTTVGELDMLTDSLCKLQNAFFNKNTTQVNVQNNYESAPAYNAFLSDEPIS